MPVMIAMPQMSPTMTEGTLARWLVAEGDAVRAGDILAEVETDKATMEIEAADDGTLARILAAEGTEGVPVGQAIAVLLREGESADALPPDDAPPPAPAAPPSPAAPGDAPPPAPTAPSSSAAPGDAAPPPPAAPAPEPPAAPGAREGQRIAASPLARSMARQAGLELATVAGSGPHGRIVKRDIEAALAAGAASPPSPPAAFQEVRLTAMRRTIAQRLQESKRTIPHFYLTADCRLDDLLALRQRIAGGRGGHKPSINDFIVRALALALVEVPEANAQWAGDAIRRFSSVDLAVAVAVEGGLVTPVLRAAEGKGLLAISREMAALVARARAGKLLPEDYRGGGFTLSNLGMYGVRQFDAVINPPQAGILAVGAGEQRPVVQDGALAVATLMTCTLSADHRVIDGVAGARLLAAFKGLLEDPLALLL